VATRTPHARTDLPGALGAGYAEDAEGHRPLASYAVLNAVFSAAFGAALLDAHRNGLPERIGGRDLLLAGIATHKLSRLIAKDKATSFIRAPFTRYQESAGHGEVEEAARGHGLRLAVGELLVCPYCLAQWIAAGFAVGYLRAPRITRVFAGMWTIHTIADALQLAYVAAEKRS
jgi:Protein of unknown function (DUF1360)